MDEQSGKRVMLILLVSVKIEMGQGYEDVSTGSVMLNFFFNDRMPFTEYRRL
jgi:hypothetical protein